jgi:glycine hydroxymethyltransferase
MARGVWAITRRTVPSTRKATMASNAPFTTHHPSLAHSDPALAGLLDAEAAAQRSTLSLIASEDMVSAALREAQASALIDRTIEGYPGRRFYAGCATVDAVETLAIERAKALFGAEHANVQPHSGSAANWAAYAGLLRPGDGLLAMDMAHGGHLTHGSPHSLSGALYRASFYGVDRNSEQLDYDAVRAIAVRERPKMIIAGGSSYPRIIDWHQLAAIASEVGALFLADIAHLAGPVATGLHPSPVPVADVVTMSTFKTLRGPRGGIVLCQARHAAAIDAGLFPGVQGSIHLHTVAAKALALHEAAQPSFRAYTQQVLANARALSDALQRRGLRVITGGTDTHLLLLDLRPLGLTGRDAERLLETVGLYVNRNGLPFDTQPPHIGSGLRLGTPTLTSRGLGLAEMGAVAALLADALEHRADPHALAAIKARVAELAEAFPSNS